MEPIFDREGRLVGWLYSHLVCDTDGAPVAFIENDHVFAYTGTHLGTYRNRWFRDEAGGATGYLRGAAGEPERPRSERPPETPPEPRQPPLRPPEVEAPPTPTPTNAWSRMSWTAYLSHKF